MTEYADFFRQNITNHIDQKKYDIFISAYNNSERVTQIYDNIRSDSKRYLLFNEYNIQSENTHERIGNNSDLLTFVKSIDVNKAICIDITGFIRPYLIFLIKALKELRFGEVCFIYSEPIKYIKHNETEFSKGKRLGVKGIDGFINEVGISNDKKILIVGAGFELESFKEVVRQYKDINTKNHRILIGFPSLRPDMFQQSMLQIHEIEDYDNKFIYAPASNPFMTAQKIHDTVKEFRENDKPISVYLAPISTKPQVLGFVLYAIRNEDFNNSNIDINIIFPFSEKYSHETSEGIAKTWKYKINFSKDI